MICTGEVYSLVDKQANNEYEIAYKAIRKVSYFFIFYFEFLIVLFL